METAGWVAAWIVLGWFGLAMVHGAEMLERARKEMEKDYAARAAKERRCHLI